MIYVLTYPKTIWERIKFQLFKTCPSIPCAYIRHGPSMVECITGEDSCEIVPVSGVMHIIWESGYKDALEHSRKEYFDGVAQAMQQMTGASVGACDCDDGECDGECSSAATYVPSGTSVDGYN